MSLALANRQHVITPQMQKLAKSTANDQCGSGSGFIASQKGCMLRSSRNQQTMQSINNFDINAKLFGPRRFELESIQNLEAKLPRSRRFCSEDYCFTHKYLHKLRSFMLEVFSFRGVLHEDLQNLSPAEKTIMRNFIAGNKYMYGQKVVDSLFRPTPDLRMWSQFHKMKTKMQNLRFGLGLVYGHLAESFAEASSCRISSKQPNKLDTQMMFYAAYFGQLEFSINHAQLTHAIGNRLIPHSRVWAKFDKYVLPNAQKLHLKSDRTRTIDQEFLRTVCRSRRFYGEAISTLLECVIFLDGNHGSQNETGHFPHPEAGEQLRNRSGLLKLAEKHNRTKTLGLFKTWESRIIAKGTFIDVGCGKSIRDSLEVVKACAKRTKTNLPWTVREVHCALVDCLLALVESSPSATQVEGSHPSHV